MKLRPGMLIMGSHDTPAIILKVRPDSVDLFYLYTAGRTIDGFYTATTNTVKVALPTAYVKRVPLTQIKPIADALGMEDEDAPESSVKAAVPQPS